jgi:hypothetical protein
LGFFFRNLTISWFLRVGNLFVAPVRYQTSHQYVASLCLYSVLRRFTLVQATGILTDIVLVASYCSTSHCVSL